MPKAARFRALVRERDGDECCYCGRTMRFEPSYRKLGLGKTLRWHPDDEATLEHLVDRQHGGSDHLHNLRLACKSCNNGRNYLSLADKLSGLRPSKTPPPPHEGDRK